MEIERKKEKTLCVSVSVRRGSPTPDREQAGVVGGSTRVAGRQGGGKCGPEPLLWALWEGTGKGRR